MKLIQLTLKNFKGCRDFTLDAGGGDVDIYGDNATFKTTLFDAFTWLLFGKDSASRAEFDIKTLTSNGQPIPGIDHEVKAILDLDGKLLTLRKVYAEQWTKKRGSAERQFTGHTTDHFIDDVPVKKTEYEARIASIVDEDVFRLLTNPRLFPEVLHWQRRREILLTVCGDVSDADVISSDKQLVRLPDILGDRSLEDHRKVIVSKRSEINRELNSIPVRIDEATKGLPVLDEPTDPDKVTAELGNLKTQRTAKQEEKVLAEAGGGVAEKTKALREVEAEIMELEAKHRAEVDDQISQAKVKLAKVNDEITTLQSQLTQKMKAVGSNDYEMAGIETRITNLRDKWTNLSASEFTDRTTCPVCLQALPETQVEEARARFNQSKAEGIEKLDKEGLAWKANIEKLKAENGTLWKDLESLRAQILQLQDKTGEADYNITMLGGQRIDYDLSLAPYAKKSQLQDEIEQAKGDGSVSTEAIAREIIALDSLIQGHENTLAQVAQREKGLVRIKDLKDQERALAAEYERLEQELYLTEQFVRAKVLLLEDRINSRFQHARFKLFFEQLNGGVAECCETLYEGIPYSTALNNSARINVGLDIINTLSEHYGFTSPIFCDNAEAVTKLLPTKGQQIRLYVSEPDKALRVEQSKEREEATV